MKLKPVTLAWSKSGELLASGYSEDQTYQFATKWSGKPRIDRYEVRDTVHRGWLK